MSLETMLLIRFNQVIEMGGGVGEKLIKDIWERSGGEID